MRDETPPPVTGEGRNIGRRTWTWWWQINSRFEMAASLDHAVNSSLEVESRAMLGLAGRMSISHKVASRGNPRSSDRSMMALCAIYFVEASPRSLLVAIDS
jgi:hypothetical protein